MSSRDNGAPRHLATPTLVVALLVSVAAIGVRTRDARRAVGASGPARPLQEVAETQASASSGQEEPSPPRPVPTARETEARPSHAAPSSATTSAATALDELQLMKQLRDMRQSDPELSLRLAREGNERFPGSPDEAERASIVVKSLMRMGRAEEATEEARAMVEKYPGTGWAVDVKRHMLDVPSYVADGSGH